MVFQRLHLALAFLLGLLHSFCSFSKHHIHLYISPPLLSFLATNSFFPSIPLFFTFLHALLLGCYDAVILFLLSSLLFLVCKFNLPLVPVLPLSTILPPLAFLPLTFLASLLLWLPFYSSSMYHKWPLTDLWLLDLIIKVLKKAKLDK